MKRYSVLFLFFVILAAAVTARAADITVEEGATRTQTTLLEADNFYMKSGSTLVMNSKNIYLVVGHGYYNNATIKVNFNTGNVDWPYPTLNQSSGWRQMHIQSGGLTINTAANVLTEFSGAVVTGVTSGEKDGGVKLTGSGTVFVMNAGNTYTGDTVLEGGSLVFRAGSATKSAIQIKNGTLQNNTVNALALASVTDADTAHAVTLAGNYTMTGGEINRAGALTLGLGKDYGYKGTNDLAAKLASSSLKLASNAKFRAGKLTVGAGTTLDMTGGFVGVGNHEYTGSVGCMKVSGAGAFLLDGGTLKMVSSVTLGGSMTMKAGTATLSNQLLFYGGTSTFSGAAVTVANNMSNESGTVNVSGGSVTASSINNNAGTFTVSGGTLKSSTGEISTQAGTMSFNAGTVSAATYIQTNGGTMNFGGANVTAGTYLLNNNGTQNFKAGNIAVGTYLKNKGKVQTVSGANITVGKANANSFVWLTGKDAVMNFESGTLSVEHYDTEYVSVRFNSFIVEGDAHLNVSGGEINLAGVLRLGNDNIKPGATQATGTGYMNMTGGTVNVGMKEFTNRSFFVGGNSNGVFTMSDGELNILNGNLIVGHNGGNGVVSISGGTVNAQGVYFYNNGGSKIAVSGGTLNIDALGCGASADYPGKGVLTLTGSDTVWHGATGENLVKFEINANSGVNFNVDVNGFSAVNADSVKLAGTAVLDSYNGVGVYSDPILLTKGLNSYTNTAAMSSAAGSFFEFQNTTDALYAVLDGDMLITDAVVSKKHDALTLNVGVGRGAVEVEFPIETIALVTDLSEDELDDFVVWLNGGNLPDGITATLDDVTGNVDLVGLVVKDDKLVWDFTSFGDGTALLNGLTFHDGSEIPEPASIVLLALGLGFVFIRRKK